MIGAAWLDPGARRIAGFATGARPGRPARIEIRLNGAVARKLVAAGPPTALSRESFAALGPPPHGACAFSTLLPAESEGAGPVDLTVAADGAEILRQRFDEPAALARYREGWVMSDSVQLHLTRMRAGAFTGRVSVSDDAQPPAIALRIRGEVLGEARLTREAAGWRLEAALPAEALQDGVGVVEFVAEGVVLARYPISAGEALAGDLAAEVASLRAELDHLKTAFRGLVAGGVVNQDERPMIVAEALSHVDALLERRDRVRAVEAETAETEEDEDWEIRE